MKDENAAGITQVEHQKQIVDKYKKRPPKREERRFEINFSVAAAYMKCAYIKIPDPIYTKRKAKDARNNCGDPERVRPFDGMFVTPKTDSCDGGIYAIEAKYGSNTLEKHQLDNLNRVKNINGNAYVIRMRAKKNKDVFYVEWPEKCILFETDSLVDLVSWFKNLSAHKKYVDMDVN